MPGSALGFHGSSRCLPKKCSKNPRLHNPATPPLLHMGRLRRHGEYLARGGRISGSDKRERKRDGHPPPPRRCTPIATAETQNESENLQRKCQRSKLVLSRPSFPFQTTSDFEEPSPKPNVTSTNYPDLNEIGGP